METLTWYFPFFFCLQVVSEKGEVALNDNPLPICSNSHRFYCRTRQCVRSTNFKRSIFESQVDGSRRFCTLGEHILFCEYCKYTLHRLIPNSAAMLLIKLFHKAEQQTLLMPHSASCWKSLQQTTVINKTFVKLLTGRLHLQTVWVITLVTFWGIKSQWWWRLKPSNTNYSVEILIFNTWIPHFDTIPWKISF